MAWPWEWRVHASCLVNLLYKELSELQALCELFPIQTFSWRAQTPDPPSRVQPCRAPSYDPPELHHRPILLSDSHSSFGRNDPPWDLLTIPFLTRSTSRGTTHRCPLLTPATLSLFYFSLGLSGDGFRSYCLVPPRALRLTQVNIHIDKVTHFYE